VGFYRELEQGDGRSQAHSSVTFTYTNLATGASVTDRGTFNNHDRDGVRMRAGLAVQLRGPDGRNLGIDAGRLVFDLGTFEVISRSGVEVGDYDAIVCAALGAEPAD
jgi:hypothetical protein